MTINLNYIIMAGAALLILAVGYLTTPPATCVGDGCRYAILK